MIVSTRYKFIICTPTKCGTEALRSVFHRRSDVAKHVLPKHRADVPPEYDKPGWTRIMTVRNPWHRLVSMFYYLRNHNSGWGQGKFKKTRFEDFIRYHQEQVEKKPCVDWTWTLSEIADQFKPAIIWKNEELEKHYLAFIKSRGIPAPQNLNRVNVSRKDSDDYDGHWNAKLLNMVEHWASKDARRFGYQRPNVKG